MNIDLHSHTHFSDGKLSVPELLMRAQNFQLDALAITDHDCVDALPVAHQWLSKNNNAKKPLMLIGGVEISTKWHGFEIHILGLDINYQSEKLKNRLKTQLDKRQERAEKICLKLHKIGITDVLNDVNKLVNSDMDFGCISRGHIAQILVQRGVCQHFQQAFTQFLGKDKKAYVAPNWISISEAIEWINDANGLAVIAHPFHYDMTTKWLRRLTSEFKQSGGDGMEVQHPNLAKAKHDLMCKIALENDLMGSAGSDFHGPSRWTELGRRLNIPNTITPIWSKFK